MTTAWLQRWREHPDEAFRDVTVLVCAFAVLFSVAWSFLNFHGRRPVARGRRSAVDTFTMLLFYAAFSALLARRAGVLESVPPGLKLGALVLGVALVAAGAAVNVIGRHQLGATWANQIAIYERHELLTGGLFRLVRHPLYASLIWMFLGAAIAYLNYAALLATALVFVPAMHYRARQEERLLAGTFAAYEAYRRRTGQFFPKLPARKRTSL